MHHCLWRDEARIVVLQRRLVIWRGVIPSSSCGSRQLSPTAPAQHVLVLDNDTRAALTIQLRALNKSAKIDAMGSYLEAVGTG